MTDEQLDARLRAAGQRWRDRTDGDTAVAELPDVDEALPPPAPRRRRTWFVAVAAAAVVALIAGLTFALRGAPRHGTPNAEAAGLQGVVWLLQGTPGARSTATFYIDRNGLLVADDDCRLIGGHATVSGQRLTVRDLVVRLAPCTDQYGPGFYDQGTNVLRGPATFTIGSSGLTIARAHVGTLHFVPAPSVVPPPSLDVPTLTDTTWRAPDGKTLRIDAASGRISGSICAGRAAVAGPTVTFTGCGPTGQGTYLATISGATLTLKAQGIDPGFSGMSSQLTFVWQPAEASIDPASLVGRTWFLQAVAGEPASTGTLRIANGSAVINDGCLSFTVPVRVARGVFSLSVRVPAHPCSAAAGTVDSLLSSNPTSWAVRGGKLIINGGGSQTFALVYAAAQPQSSTLQGDWTLAKVFDGAGAPQTATAPATLNIEANGTVTGTDGCRTFTGTVSSSGTSATFSLTMPEPACSPTVEQTAGLVDRVLSGPVTFTIGSGLLLLNNNEIGRLSFTGKAVGGQDPELLTAHGWQITTITYGTGYYRNGASSQDHAFLSFSTNRYSLGDACSILRGTAQFAAGAISLTRTKTFDHSCPPPPPNQTHVGEAAEAIDAILIGQVRWSIDGSVLTLTSGRGSLHAVGGVPSDLTGSRWRLISTAQGNTSRTAVGTVVLSFPADDRLRVDRCYTSGAEVAVGDSSLIVSQLRTTVARPCPSGPPGTQQQDETIDSVLTAEPVWSIVDNTLTLTGAGASLIFRR